MDFYQFVLLRNQQGPFQNLLDESNVDYTESRRQDEWFLNYRRNGDMVFQVIKQNDENENQIKLRLWTKDQTIVDIALGLISSHIASQNTKNLNLIVSNIGM